MALTTRLLRPLPLALGLGCTAAATYRLAQHRSFAVTPLRADAPRGFGEEKSLREAAQSSARKSGLNVRIMRQISTGSILGLLGGLALSLFSKPLTILFGVTLLGAQFMESRGIHVIPYKRIQRYFGSIDIQNALTANLAFKISFAAIFTLAGFAEF